MKLPEQSSGGGNRILPGAHEDRSKRMHPVSKLRYHPEITPAAPQAPEQFRLAVHAGVNFGSIGRNQVDAVEAVDRQTEAAAEPAHAAAQGEAGSAGV